MSDGTDWLWRPIMRKICTVDAYLNGLVDLSMVAQMNEALDVLDENDYRANLAARSDK